MTQSSQSNDVVRTIKLAAQAGHVKVIKKVMRAAIAPQFIGDESTAANKYFDNLGYKYINE